MALCSVCSHPQAHLINAALNGGMSQREVERQFPGVGHDAARRHVNGMHPGVVRAPDATRPGVAFGDGSTPREDLEQIRRALKDRIGHPDWGVEDARELRIVSEAIDKMSGGQKPRPTSVYELEGYEELEAAMFLALEPFPEARQAVARMLRQRLEA